MAIYNKKLKVSGSSGVQNCNIYSTSSEAGNNRMLIAFDGNAGYVALNTVNHARATKGMVSKNNNTMSILSVNKPLYTEKSWTIAGTYTFTVPTGVTRIRVAACGGGGGSVFAGDNEGRYISNYNNADGNSSSAFDVVATGGTKGVMYSDGNRVYAKEAGKGGSPNGRDGVYCSRGSDENRFNNQPKGFALSFVKQEGEYGRSGVIKITSSYPTASTGGQAVITQDM